MFWVLAAHLPGLPQLISTLYPSVLQNPMRRYTDSRKVNRPSFNLAQKKAIGTAHNQNEDMEERRKVVSLVNKDCEADKTKQRPVAEC